MKIFGSILEVAAVVFRSNSRNLSISPASQSVGDSTITIPNMANTTQSMILSSQIQTLSNKILDNSNIATFLSNAFTLQDSTTISKQAIFDLSAISSSTTRSYAFPNATTTLVGTDTTQTLSNKTLGSSNTFSLGTTSVIDIQDINFVIHDASVPSKTLSFNAGGTAVTNTTISAAQTADRVITLPDATTTLVGTDTAQDITAKTKLEVDNLRLDGNTISTTNSNGDLTITPNGTGVINSSSHLLLASGKALVFNNANTTAVIAASASANRIYTIPDTGNDTEFVMRFGAQTIFDKKISADGADACILLSETGTNRKIAFDIASASDTTTTTLKAAQTANRTVTFPDATDTLVGKATSDILTNKTISGASNTITNVSLTSGVTGTLPIGNGGTGQVTANAALNALLPSQTGNTGKFLTTNGTDSSWATVAATDNTLFTDTSSGSRTITTGNALFFPFGTVASTDVYTINSGAHLAGIGSLTVASTATLTVSGDMCIS